MTFAAHTIPFIWHETPSATVDALAQRGFRQLEFFAAPGYIDIWAPASEAAATLRRALATAGSEIIGIDISTHDYNLASVDRRVADFTVSAYERLMDVASELGIRSITVHGGRRIAFNAPPGALQWDALRSSFDRLARAAERRSFEILIENIAASVLNGAATMGRFLAEGGWSNAFFVYDVANGVAAGEDPAAALVSILPKVKAVHVSDDEHGAIGSGSIDFRAVHRVLEAGGYAGHVVLEICSPAALDDLAAAPAALRALGWS